LDVIHRERLEDNARNTGEFLKTELQNLARKFPGVIRNVRGLGLMLGVELAAEIPSLLGEPNKSVAVRFTNLLHGAGLLAIPAGTQIIRLLPALNLTRADAQEGIGII